MIDMFSWCGGGSPTERHVMFVFTDANLQHSYDLFREKETCRTAAVVVMALQTLIQILYLFSTFNEDFVILRMLRLLFLIPGYFLLHALYRRATNEQPGYLSWGLTVPRLSNMYLFLASVTYAIMFVLRCLADSCQSTSIIHTLGCNPYREVHSVPADSAVGLIISVFAVQMILCTCYWRVIVICWTLNFICLIVMIVVTHATLSVLFPVLYILTFCASWAYERNVMQRFLALRHVETLVRKSLQVENEQHVMEMRSVEMRHLLGNVAHDLKTPMQSFVMDLELVDKIMKRPVSQTAEHVTYSTSQQDSVRDTIQNVYESTAFMQMIINRSIDYTISSSDYTLMPQMISVDITEVIEWTLRLIRGRSTVPISFEPLPSDINSRIVTDKQWLIENILCLISNAAKFTTTGGVTVRCEVLRVSTSLDHNESSSPDEATTSQVDELLIEVEDTGIGIPEDKRELMFRPFQQTMRMAGGTGLGLYSLRNRVEALKGTCGICDRRDGAQGTCVWFRIPYQCDNTPISPRTDVCMSSYSRSASSTSLSHDLKEDDIADVDAALRSSHCTSETCVSPAITDTLEERSNILLVDDAMIVRKSISRALQNEGMAVDIAENGEVGLNMMKAKRYDVVLMDLQMPVMDGFEATRLFRVYEEENCVSSPQIIIGISAFSESEYRTSALACGMNDFISKPFTAQALLEKCAFDGFLNLTKDR